MSQIIGHSKNKDWLLSQSKNQSLPSSIIFHGPTGIGKKTLALALLQSLNCKVSELGCGTCSSCVRILEEKNEMIHLLTTEDKKSIGVDQVRDIQSFYQLKTHHEARFVIVDPADKLSISAANSLLKVLEEPSEKTHFILITDQIRSLLPTIRSRSHILNFSQLTKQELQSYTDFTDLAVNWSDGRLTMALELQSDDKVSELNNSIQLFYSLLCEHPTDWKKKAPWFFNNDYSREFCFNIWKQALEKRLYQSSENLEFIPESPGKISQIFEEMGRLQTEIKSNVDKLLALENFYYRVRPVMMSQ